MTLPRPVRVVGVGSPHGDDAAGWEVVQWLRQRLAGAPGVEFHLADGGPRCLDLLDGRGTLVLVDALFGDGGSPGTIHRLEWPDERIESLHAGSTHAFRPAEALRLAAALGLLPERVVVCGIEAGGVNPGDGLSPAVAAAIAELVDRLADELRERPKSSGPAACSW
jgi:hydrogenase maturation protease